MQSWTTVTTTNLPAWNIIGHAKHLLSQGAYKPIYFLDDPAIYADRDIQELRKFVRFIICDTAYWQKLGGMPTSIPHRQLVNLRVARANCNCNWFLHIDSDEFLFSEMDFNNIFENLPNEVIEVRLKNCERVTRPSQTFWHTGALRMPCWRHDLILSYGEKRRQFLAFGLAEYFHGKSFVRKNVNAAQGIHGALQKSDFDAIRFDVPIGEAFIAHYQYLGESQFHSRMIEKKNRSAAMFKHERSQFNWAAHYQFRKEYIVELARLLFVAEDDDIEKWKNLGLYRDIPASLLRTIENSFVEEHLVLLE